MDRARLERGVGVLHCEPEFFRDIARRVVGLGAIQPEELRTFTLSVEMAPASGSGKRSTRH